MIQKLRDIQIKWKLTIVFILIFLFFMVISGVINYFLMAQSIEEMAEKNLKTSAKNIMTTFESAYRSSRINYLRAIAEKNLDIIRHFYNKHDQQELTKEEALKQISDILLSQKIGDTGYIAVLNSKGVTTIHPNKNIIAKNITRFKFVQEMIEKKQGYIEYMWGKPKKQRQKSMYCIYFQPWDMIIGVTSNKSEFMKLVNINDFKKDILDLKFGKSGYGFVFTRKGKILIHPKYSTGEDVLELKDHNDKFYIREMINNKEGVVDYYYKDSNTGDVKQKLASHVSSEKLNLVVGTSLYYKEIFAPLIRQKTILILILLITFVIITPILLLMVMIFFKPLKKATIMLKKIVKGQGDLTQTVNIRSYDEIGVMASYFNDFILFLKSMIVKVKNESDYIQELSHNIDQYSRQSTQVVTDIKDTIDRINLTSSELASEADISNQSLNNVKQAISRVTELITLQANAINESSASVSQMSGSIQNIAGVSESKLKIAFELEKTAGKGEKDMAETMTIINKVAESANVISEMIGVINGIAEQTNLLAMNAAIEAAHAGDAGKGFAVVADEIRKLAENTGKNSKEISQSLQLVISDIHLSEETTRKTGESFSSIVKGIKELADSMMEMSKGTEEMAIGSKQIIQSLDSLIKYSEDVKSSSKDMDTTVIQVTHSIDKFKTVSNSTKNEVLEISSGMKSITEAVEQISELGVNNINSVAKLEKLMNQFKV